MLPKLFRHGAVAILSASFLAVALPAANAAALPGGATSLNESFGSWQIVCRGDADHCVMAQALRQKKTNRLVFSMQLRVTPAGTIEGDSILPFGLAVTKGATLQSEKGKPGQPIPFRTCLPVGCVVPVNLNNELVSTLNSGNTLIMTATSADGKKPVRFTVQPDGFAAGLKRLESLVAGK